MWECRDVTNAAFMHLCGIQSLKMECCNQETITDAAFVHLRGIHTLSSAAATWRPSRTRPSCIYAGSILSKLVIAIR